LISQEADVDVNDASRKKDFQLTLTSGHLEIDGGIPNEHKDTENNNSPSSLRRRTTQETKSELKGDLTEKHSRKRILRDPLNWFGVLIPLSLRESQRHFKQGLLGMINIINLRNEILKKEVEYETLKRKKERMVTEAQAKPNNAEDYVQCD
ncbi:11504_t:CDS:2, partial [Acaulospora colombiana]